MTVGHFPEFDLVDGALRQLGTGQSVTEAHGNLCGLACVRGRAAAGMWMAALVEREAGGPSEGRAGDDSGQLLSEEDRQILQHLAISSCAVLDAGDMSFMPLLPPDESPLPERTAGLAGWCAGFMEGLGEADGGGPAREVLEAATSREILGDFGEIARLNLDHEVDPQVDRQDSDLEAESAYAELVEFVRVSAQLLFEELYPVRQGLGVGRDQAFGQGFGQSVDQSFGKGLGEPPLH
jgi:uncharacterized protein